MTFSKNVSFVLFAAALGMSACSTESRRAKDYVPGQGTDFQKESGTNFRVDSVKVLSTIPVSKEEGGFTAYGFPRSKHFNFQACLKDTNNGAILPNMPFRISDDEGVAIDVITNIDGCVSWSERHSYAYLATETYYRFARNIRGMRTYKGSVSAVVAFDPWQDGAAAVVDLRYTTLPTNSALMSVGSLSIKDNGLLTQQAAGNLNINVDTVSFEFRGLDYDNYSIDRLLNLTVAQKYQIRLKPMVLRKTIANVAKAESFVGGKMKAYFAIFREQKDPAKMYTMENLVSVTEFNLSDDLQVGTFISDLSLKFSSIVDLTSRTQAVLTLVPVEEILGVPELSFYGVLKPGRLAALTLSPSKVSARDFAERAKAQEIANKEVRPMETFATKSGYTVLDLKPVSVYNGFWYGTSEVNTAEVVQRALDNKLSSEASKELKQVLCAKVFAGNDKVVAKCQQNPDKYMSAGRRDFANEILSKPRKINKEPIVDTLKMSIAYTYARSANHSVGWKFDAAAGLSGSLGLDLFGGLLGSGPLSSGAGPVTPPSTAPDWKWSLLSPLSGSLGLKLSAGGTAYYGYDSKSTWGRSTSVGISSDVNVTSEGHQFAFDVQVQPCIFAVQKADPNAPEDAPRPKGVYYCSSQTRKELRTETYFLLGQAVGGKDSLFTDSDSANEVSWRMFLRGQGTKSLLFNVIKSSYTVMQFDQIPDDLYRGELNATQTMMQEYPGMLSN